MPSNSNNNFAEFGTFKRASTSFRFNETQEKEDILSNLNKLHKFYDMMGLDFHEDTFKNILKD